MPSYTFKNNETEEEITLFMSMKELDEYKNANPNMTQILSPTPLADPTRLGLHKPDSAFRDLLKDMSKKHRGSIINSW